MDQDAFRNLLQAPSRPGTGRAAGVLGAPVLKRGQAGSSKPKDVLAPKKDEKPAFVPRKYVKKESKYVDRAEQRRLGVDDEFKPVEQMLAQFEKRAHEDGEDEASIAEKRRYLGGTAEQSILIKGLDYALLAQRKAELDAKDEQEFEDALEDALGSGSGLTSGPSESQVKDGKGKGKMSRDDLVKELKRKREMEAGRTREEEEDDEDVMGVGFSKKAKKQAVVVEEPKVVSLGSKFKSISQKKAEAQAAEDAKLKKRKKKKKLVPTPDAAPTTAIPAQSEPAPSTEQDEQPAIASSSSTLPSAPPKIEAPVEEEPEIEDIFGGVGEYEANIASDSDSEDGEVGAGSSRREEEKRVAAPVVVKKSRGKWFDDGEDDGPAPIASSSKPVASVPSRHARSRSGSLSRSPSPEPTHIRLVGLSSSALPSASELLALDKAAEAAEKRKEKKAKWRAKQGLSKQDDGGDDEDEEGGGWRGKEEKEGKGKDNREAQRLTAYMAKKEKK